jgi:nucleoredoxin
MLSQPSKFNTNQQPHQEANEDDPTQLEPEVDTYVSYFGQTFLHGQEEIAASECLQNMSVVCLYFAAKSSPPCRIFTPVLKEFYNEVNMLGKVMEIIYVSRDSKKETFEDFFQKMPWLAIPLNEEDRIMQFKKEFKISGIPSLVVMSESGKLITLDGRKDVVHEGEEGFLRWKKKADEIREQEEKEKQNEGGEIGDNLAE